MSFGNCEKKSHQCPPGCRACIENQRVLLQTPEGQDVLYNRYARVINEPQKLGAVRACSRVRNGRILAIGEPIGNSKISAVADGNFLTKNTFEVAVYENPDSRDVKGAASIALERLSDKAAEIARQSGESQLTLIAKIANGNEKSAHFFRNRGYIAEDPLGFLQTGFHELHKNIDL